MTEEERELLEDSLRDIEDEIDYQESVVSRISEQLERKGQQGRWRQNAHKSLANAQANLSKARRKAVQHREAILTGKGLEATVISLAQHQFVVGQMKEKASAYREKMVAINDRGNRSVNLYRGYIKKHYPEALIELDAQDRDRSKLEDQKGSEENERT